jgi:hypothetical protein
MEIAVDPTKDTPKPAVVLFSYRRPELTKQAIERIQAWSKFEKLVVSVDGLRADASEDEKSWRDSTIRISEELAGADSRIDLRVWGSNNGLTSHSLRALGAGLHYSSNIIALEEDVELSLAGFDFLNQNSLGQDSPLAASSYSRYLHPGETQGSRGTSFPEQWGTAFNLSFLEEFEKIAHSKSIRASIVEKIFVSRFHGLDYFQKVGAQFWTGLFLEALHNPNRPDAIKAYTAMSLGIEFRVPWNPLSVDLSHLDSRGMNPRRSSLAVDHLVAEDEARLGFCSACEYANAHLNLGRSWTTTRLLQKFQMATRTGPWRGIHAQVSGPGRDP